MKLLSIQGHFGNMDGRKIVFEDGFCSYSLPNGWGKTTLCAFIRVMLYGLNTARRDTAAALSEKTKYFPQDGMAMSGRLTLEWRGRPITLERRTSRAGLMQDFEAYYEDTKEPCLFLSAKNCGETLLGMSEDAFLSSALMDGGEMVRSSAELVEQLTAMSQSGDPNESCAEALKTLARWRLDLNSGNGHGEQNRIEQSLREVVDKLDCLDTLDKQLGEQREQVKKLEAEAEEAQKAYENEYLSVAGTMTDEDSRYRILQEDSERKLRELADGLPDEHLLRQAAEALYGYEGGVQLEGEKRKAMPHINTDFQGALREIDRRQHEDEVERNKAAKPRIRWPALVIALLLAIAAAGTAIVDVNWGPYTQYAPYVLSALTVFAILMAFVGSVPKEEEKPEDYDAQRRQVRIAQERTVAEQQMASSVLQEARDHVIEEARRIWPQVQTVEQAAEWIAAAQETWQAYRREQSHMQDILLAIKRRQEESEDGGAKQDEVERLRQNQLRKRRVANTAMQMLAELEGRSRAIGERAELVQQGKQLSAALKQSEEQRRAIIEAERIIKEENAARTAMVSPRVTALAEKYLAYLTDNAYREIKLDANLTARAADSAGRLLDKQRLSAGTRDQLYFAVRLAVCQVLAGDEPFPLIMDDPFLTWDTDRIARGLALLKDLSRERQIIFLTCR